jgi:hypothetical protein
MALGEKVFLDTSFLLGGDKKWLRKKLKD